MASEERISTTQKGRLVDIPESSDLVSGNSLSISAAKTILEECESTTGWTAQGQADNLTTSVTHTHGTKSLSFAKSGVAGTTGYIDKTTVVANAGVYQTHAIIHMNFYLSDISNIVKAFMRIGTDSSNYFQYDHLVADMDAGWSDSDHMLTRPNSQTGDGADFSSITYVAFGVEMSAAGDTLTGILVDNITVKRMVEILSFAGVQIPPATRNVVITDRNSNLRADVAADGAFYALHVKSVSLASESTLGSVNTKITACDTGSVTIGAALPAGTNTIGSVGVVSLPTLPAGTNTIGSVGVTTLPALPTGTNTIGSVGVVSLPTIPAGVNTIGSVGVTSLPSIPAGTNNIGDVDIASALPAGTNTIGSVGVTSLPTLPVGTNTIGSVGVVSLPTLPAGTNNIGDVDIASVAAGTVTIGAVQDAGVKYTPKTYTGTYTAAQTDAVIWTPGTQTSIVLLGAYLSVKAEMDIELESNNVDVLPPGHFAANGGAVVSGGGPVWKGDSSDTLTVTSSAAGSHSVMVWGYEE